MIGENADVEKCSQNSKQELVYSAEAVAKRLSKQKMDAAWIVREADMAEKESWLDFPENTGTCERRLAKACARAYAYIYICM